MAFRMYISACIISVLLMEIVTGSELRVIPSNNEFSIGGSNPSPSLTLTCRSASAQGLTNIFALTIGKVPTGISLDAGIPTQYVIAVVKLTVDIALGPIGNSMSSRLTYEGAINSINDVTTSMRVVITDLRCTDAGQYVCEAQGTPGGTHVEGVNVTARSIATNVQMFLSPDRVKYDVGEKVEISCNGNIGNTNIDTVNPNNNWRWQWRSIDSEFTSWQSYPGQQNITSTVGSTSNCQTQSRSTLTHYLSNIDNGRQFRCSPFADNTISDNRTVFTETPPVTGNPGGVSNPDSADIGMILGIVFGVLAAIVIVIVLVYIFVFRRKPAEYDTGEGKENSGPDTYATPHGHTQEKPHPMTGRENTGLDEPQQDKRPQRPNYVNSSSFEKGGRTNPAMRDDNSSRHSYDDDDDNTDTSRGRIAAPSYGSAV